MILRAPGRKPIFLRPVRPSAAEAAWYQVRLGKLVDAMHASTLYWVKAKWSALGLAQDRTPSEEFQATFNRLAKQWARTFKSSAKEIARSFANKNRRHHDQAFRDSLDKAGFTVKFQTTPVIEAALSGAIKDNVDLIRSIPAEYFADVRERVRESVERGRSMAKLTKDLEHVHGVTRSRAALIARDQNNKVTALVHKLRQKQVGITQAVWVHTAASQVPREEHEEWGAEGIKYDIETGMYSDVDGEFVWPGTPINCGCTCMSVVPGHENDGTETEEVEP